MEGVREREMSGVDGRVMAGVVGVDTTLMGGMVSANEQAPMGLIRSGSRSV
jgi:hypothetical protein